LAKSISGIKQQQKPINQKISPILVYLVLVVVVRQMVRVMQLL
jgi:hypothetical protein